MKTIDTTSNRLFHTRDIRPKFTARPNRALNRLRVQFAAFLALGVWLGVDPLLGAATMIVGTKDDGGPGPLRQAIVDSLPDGIVAFAPGLSGTIILTNGELVVGSNLTIAGPGPSVLTVTAQGSRAFNIQPGINGTISGLGIVDVKNAFVNITNGFRMIMHGGAVTNAGMLALTNCALTGNSAAQNGGAIYSSGTLTLNNCTLTNNSTIQSGSGGVWPTIDTVYGGGALYSVGTLTVKNCTLIGNTAVGWGGLYAT